MARISRKNPAPVIKGAAVVEVFKTAIYLRLSLEDNGKKDTESIETQRALVQAYVEERPYLELVETYVDNGCTGTDFERPDFKRMMDDARSGKINCIVVKDLSRLGRNYVEVGNYLEKVFPFLNLRFIAVNDRYDSNSVDSSDQLMAALKNLINDAYAKDISRKISTTMEQKRLRGEFLGAYAPYGYLRDPGNPNKLIIDPETCWIVQEIFEIRATGIGIEKVCRALNEKGYPSPGRLRYERGIKTCNNKKGSELPWNRHVVNDILHNVVYIGNLAQGRSGSSLYKGIPFHWKDPSEWVVVNDTHEPIISMELWNKVQEINNRRTKKVKDSFGKNAALPRRENPYGSLLRCACCGRVIKQVRSFNNKGGKDYYTYKCPQYIELGESACAKRTLKAAVLDEIVLSTLKAHMNLFIKKQDALRRLMDEHHTEERAESIQQQKQRASSALEQKKKQSTQLYADFREGIIDQESYVYAKQHYQTDIDVLEQELYELQYRETRTVDVIIGEKHWSDLIDKYYNAETVSAEMVSAMIESITFHADASVEIQLRFSNEIAELMAEEEKIKKGVA